MAIKNTARYMANSPMLTPWARQMMSRMWDVTDKFPWLSTRVVSNMLNATKDIDDEEERKATLNELYRAALPIAQNNDRLDERDEILNQKAYEISQMQDWDQKNMQITALKLWDLSNKIKRTYSDQISADADDNEVLNQFIAQIPDWQKMLENYLNNWDKELLYAWWLATKQVEEVETPEAQWWWVRSLINNPNEQNMFWDKETTAWNILDMMNIIWEWAEDIDNVVNRYIPTITWEKAVNNLADRINNLSDEEIAQLRKQYSNMINAIEDDDQYTAWEILSDLWTTLWYYFNPIQRLVKGEDQIKQEATEAVTRFTQARKKDGKWWEISKKAAMSDEAFKKWLIDNQATFGEYMIWANETLQWINTPNVVKFFSNIPWSAIKTLTATIRWMTNPYDTLTWLIKLIGTEEWHQALKARYGSWDALANSINTDPVWVADDILSITQMAWWAVQKVWKLTWLSWLEKVWWYVNTNIWSATDALAWKAVWNIYWAIDNNLINSSNKLVSNAWKYMEATSNLWKWIEYGKEWLVKAADKLWKVADSNLVTEVVNKITWIDKEDRQFIRNNKEIAKEYLDWTKNVDTALETVVKKIEDAQNENSKIWQEYNKLRESWQTANTKWITTDLSDKLSKKWITIDAEWNLSFDKYSKYNASQKKAIQSAWEVIKDAEFDWKLTADQILNLRQKLDDAINRENKSLKSSAVDKDAEWLIKSFREALDTRAKTDIEWLKVLDEKYWESVAELKKIKKDWFNSDWTLKDNAKSKLRNLTKAWNEEKLARLEKVAPWISKDLKALEVWLSVDNAMKRHVWDYSKWALIWGSIVTALKNPLVWIPSAVLSLYLSNPKNVVNLLLKMPETSNKILAWEKLSAIDVSKMQNLANETQTTVARTKSVLQ